MIFCHTSKGGGGHVVFLINTRSTRMGLDKEWLPWRMGSKQRFGHRGKKKESRQVGLNRTTCVKGTSWTDWRESAEPVAEAGPSAL